MPTSGRVFGPVRLGLSTQAAGSSALLRLMTLSGKCEKDRQFESYFSGFCPRPRRVCLTNLKQLCGFPLSYFSACFPRAVQK